MEFLEQTFYNNTIQNWLIAAAIIVGGITLLSIIKMFIHRHLLALSQKTDNEIDDLIAELVLQTKFIVLLVVAVFVSSFYLTLPDKINIIVNKIFVITLLLQGAFWGTAIIKWWIGRYRKQKIETDAASVTTFNAIGFLLRIFLWTIILLLTLDNLGINITALVAGLGIGGIAIALALQNILGDLFASLSIVLDKPFVIGDFIIIDNYLGSVEHVGLKTTRIRSLSGEQLVFSNNDLLNSRIRNYKRMYERRVLFTFGVVYQTPHEKLKIIPGLVQEIIESNEQVRFDRAHFKDYGNFSLNFEVVYWVKVPDYNVYMDIQQQINLDLYRKFEKEKIEFAYPTQTLFLNKETGEASEGLHQTKEN
jgi:small-conductance mechanosensitive channel